MQGVSGSASGVSDVFGSPLAWLRSVVFFAAMISVLCRHASRHRKISASSVLRSSLNAPSSRGFPPRLAGSRNGELDVSMRVKASFSIEEYSQKHFESAILYSV